MEPGRLIAAGRDSEIFEFGPDLVLRRALGDRSLNDEARVMEFARSAGYPVPSVHEVRAGGTELVMDRVVGPTQLVALLRRPWTIGRQAAMLARLHERLHAITAPEWLPPVPDGGNRLLHLDLHPLNVILTGSGPVVIDWTNARAGEDITDVTLTYVLLRCAQPAEEGLPARIVDAFRKRFAASFLSHFDSGDVAQRLPAVVEAKCEDQNMTEAERAAMRDLADESRGWQGRTPR